MVLRAPRRAIQQRQVIFHGNSLSDFGDGLTLNVQRFPTTCYNSIKLLNKSLAYSNRYSTGGRRTYQMTADFATEVGNNSLPNDILIFWEICNDAHDKVSDTAGTAIYQDVLDYCAVAQTYGLRIVVLTGIPRLYPGLDDAGITSRIFACNALMRANATPPWELLIDVASLSQFDAEADINNATYYMASDKTHLTNAGYDLIAGKVYTDLNASGIMN